jgi:outer membrane protein
MNVTTKTIRWTTVAWALILGAGWSLGAAAADLKIGVVNIAQLLDQSPQAKVSMGALQDEFAPRQRDIVALQKELREKEERLQRDGAVMGEDERGSLERDVRDERRELARSQNEYVEDLNLRRNEELGKLQRALLQQVQGYAKLAGYDLIVADVLWASPAIDITAEVLAALNQAEGKN